MNKSLKILGFGLIVWVIPTIITLLASYFGGPYLFDVISAVSITISVIVFAYIYFRDITTHFIREGVTIGIVWVIISLVLDVVLIFLNINKVSLMEYAVYIAPLYIIIPAITIGLGLYRNQMDENIQIQG